MAGRDYSFDLEPMAAVLGQPPFTPVFVARRPTERCWDIRDAGGLTVGRARTRRGARMGVAAVYRLRDAPAGRAAA